MRMPGYFSKIPVVIQAMQYDGTDRSAGDIIQWTCKSSTPAEISKGELRVKTLESAEGSHVVSIGDWVIRGVAGEHYPCKPDIFDRTYREERGYPYDRPEHKETGSS